jgi:hypothetical protein
MYYKSQVYQNGVYKKEEIIKGGLVPLFQKISYSKNAR